MTTEIVPTSSNPMGLASGIVAIGVPVVIVGLYTWYLRRVVKEEVRRSEMYAQYLKVSEPVKPV